MDVHTVYSLVWRFALLALSLATSLGLEAVRLLELLDHQSVLLKALAQRLELCWSYNNNNKVSM